MSNSVKSKEMKTICFLETKSFKDLSSKFGDTITVSLAEIVLIDDSRYFIVGDSEGILASFEEKENALNYFSAFSKK